MTTRRPTDRSLATSKAIQRRTGATFHVATRFLPERAREPTYVLYAFFRVADEVVDDPGEATASEQRAELESMRSAVTGRQTTDDQVLAATNRLRERHDIDEAEFDVFVDAMLADVTVDRYHTYADLETYLRGSSVAVAEMLLDVMAPDVPEKAHDHAAALAEAFQLTNFLRDVREDAREHGRVYLPLETLERYGVAEADVRAERFTDGFADVIEHELARAEERYRAGVAGIEYLPDDVQFGVLAAAVLYADHHRLIRDRGYDVLSGRPTLSWIDRLRAVARTALHWRLTGDPVVTFDRGSAVPRRGEAGRTDTGGRLRGIKDGVTEGLFGWSP